LETVETRTEWGNAPRVGASEAPSPTFNGTTSWSVFRRQIEIIAEHTIWWNQENSTYLITTLKGQAADVLTGIPTNTTYKNNLQALEDSFGDQPFAVAYRCQVTRTQKAGKCLQDFAIAYPMCLPHSTEDHIGRESGKSFAYGVQDPDIKIQLLLGGEKQ
jgi:hypothetical protein